LDRREPIEVDFRLYANEGLAQETIPGYRLESSVGSRVTKTLNIRNRCPQREVTSHQGISMMRNWLQECVDEHNMTCKSESPRHTELPSRLINVGNENSDLQVIAPYFEDVKAIIASPEQILRYAALSYCWGQHQTTFKTSTSNIDSLKIHSFWPRPIPMTIEDAITMTKALGLRYLWIDALCIIQDDQKDFDTEIIRMASIYRNSYVTIVAANASSSTDGFIYHRFMNDLHPIFFRPKLPPSVQGMLYLKMPEDRLLQRQSEPEKTWEMIENSVWNSRDWTFQERHLSNRCLYFGLTTVHFLCNARYHCEIQTGDFVRQGHWLPGVMANLVYRNNEPHGANHSNNMAELTDMIYEVWYGMVSEYSRKDLTNPPDKLPAISGMARTLQAALRQNGHVDQYLAGLWEKNLRRGLLWYVPAMRMITTDQLRQSEPKPFDHSVIGPS
jgi:hypothetical protein